MGDYVTIIILIILILICFALLKFTKNKERENKMLEKSRKDMIDLESITKNIEETYKPINIKLTSYEEEQENNAIISYEELISNSKSDINYEDDYDKDGINVKKVDLNTTINESVIDERRIEVSLMNYEKEEEFLRALKQLQSNLIR